IDNAETAFGLLQRLQELDIPITRQLVRHVADERSAQQLGCYPGDGGDGFKIEAHRDQRDSGKSYGLCDLCAHHIAYALGATLTGLRGRRMALIRQSVRTVGSSSDG